MQWRRRTRGTKRQIGQAFPLERESMQHKKGLLPKLRGMANSERMKALREAYNEALKPKEQKLLESDILNPEEIKYLTDKGLMSIDDDGEVELTAQGIAYLQKRRMKERPQEYDTRDGQPHPKLTEKVKEWEEHEHEGENW